VQEAEITTITIPEKQWPKLYKFIQEQDGVYAGSEADLRRFLEAVLWILRSGAQWRLLPLEYGRWNSVYKRYARWSDAGVWAALYQYCADDPDLEYLLLDSTAIRAHPCAAGAPAEKGGSRIRR
jgi:transposase